MTKRERATSARRLLKLADLLDTVPEEKFDFETWAQGTEKAQLGECGTTGCALGWATAIPSFRKLGLVLDGTTPAIPEGRGTTRVLYGTMAACRLFLLDHSEASRLFVSEYGLPEIDGWTVATPEAVADRIREFVKKNRT